MKLIVFGATGRTGHLVVEQALTAGHVVVAVARHPDQLALVHEHLTIMPGDVMQATSFAPVLAGQDAVISALGVVGLGPTQVFSLGMTNIIAAMQAAGVRRIVAISAGGIDPGPVLPRLAGKLVLQRVFANSYKDMEHMESLLQASNLDWTIMRPAMLTNGKLSTKYRTAVNRHLTGGWVTPRAELADYMVNHIVDPTTYHAWVEIAR